MRNEKIPEFLRQRETWGALLTVAAIAAVVVLVISPGGDADGSTARPGAAGPARVGEPAPNFVLDTLSGGTFELARVSGRPVWINVWASWCPPCRAEMPDVVEVQRDAVADGLVFLAVNDGEPAAAISSYLTNTGYDFPVGMDVNQEFVDAYQVLGLPTHIFISADGEVAGIRVGSMTRAEMEEATASLLSGLDLAAMDSMTGAGSTFAGALYDAQCYQCHGGADGIVQSPAAPPHTGDGHTWHHGDDQLRDVVMLGQGEMPAFGDVLTEEQVMSVIEYIKGWWSDEQRRYQADVTATQTR